MARSEIRVTLAAPGLAALAVALEALQRVAELELAGDVARAICDDALTEVARLVEGVTTVDDLLTCTSGPV